MDILYKHQDALSMDKFDLGLAKDFTHKIHLKSQDPVYRKQFKIPEAHHQFIEQTLDEWLKLGVVKRSNSLYNSPIFCVPKKQGQGLRIVQDFRELNQNSHIDKYSMKEITECIGDIGRANSTIFTTLEVVRIWCVLFTTFHRSKGSLLASMALHFASPWISDTFLAEF